MRGTEAPSDRDPRRAGRAGAVRLSRARPDARLARAERPIRLAWPAPRSRPAPNRASRGRSGRAPLRAARGRARRPKSRHRAPGARRCAPTPAAPLRRSPASPSPRLLDLAGERAVAELHVYVVAWCEAGRGADDLVLRADDRVAAFERCARRERAQPSAGLLEPSPSALEEQRGPAAEPLLRLTESPDVAVEQASRARFQGGAPRLETLQELAEVGYDDPRRRCRRRGANVGDQVAERRVLLMPDRRDDRHR